MTGAERGYLLLCADLGTQARPLTLPQLRELRRRVRESEAPEDPDRTLTAADLRALGYDEAQSARIAALLGREAELDAYLQTAAMHEIHALTIVSCGYPRCLIERLGETAPPVLFYRGERSLLDKPAVSLVGSRRLAEPGRAFSERVGELAAREGYVLVSGGAVGADSAAQAACLAAGGSVIAVLPDSLAEHEPGRGVLYLCEDGWHLPFTGQRALRRNRIIHALGNRRFVAQCDHGFGGSWSGSVEALRQGLPVYVHDDGSEGARALAAMGAEPLALSALQAISTLQPAQLRLL